eukprot:7512832-Ditylum_brightwellii.AAC.1
MNLRTGKLITRREFNEIPATQAVMKRVAQRPAKQHAEKDLIVYDHNQIPINGENELDHSQDDDHFAGVDDHEENNDSDTEPNDDSNGNFNDDNKEEEKETP